MEDLVFQLFYLNKTKMKIISNTLTNILQIVDVELIKLENNLKSKNDFIDGLLAKIAKLESEKKLEIFNKNEEIVKYGFSETILEEGLGISGVRLLLEIKKHESIKDVNKFLKQLGL